MIYLMIRHLTQDVIVRSSAKTVKGIFTMTLKHTCPVACIKKYITIVNDTS